MTVLMDLVSPGTILARDGAWNRKYRVVAIAPFPKRQRDLAIGSGIGIRNLECARVLITLEFLGNYYAGTKEWKPSKYRPKQDVFGVESLTGDLYLSGYWESTLPAKILRRLA